MANTDSSPASTTTTQYGPFPTYLVAQRASSVQITSAMASSTDFGATQLAWQIEVSDTLIALGYWRGSA